MSKTEQHYITLRSQFPMANEGENIPVTMDELQGILDCTRRNAQLVLTRLVEQKLIEWHPGRGRGHASTIVFLHPLHQFVIEKAKLLVLEEQLDEAWKLIHSQEIPLIRYKFMEWLYGHLGFLQDNQKKDILRLPFYRPILDLDPTYVNRRTEAHLVAQLFNTLVFFDKKTMTVGPQLAHFWESNEDQTKWRFYLRKGVRFHHGKRLDAEDVVFTFQRLLDHSPHDHLKSCIKKILAVSP